MKIYLFFVSASFACMTVTSRAQDRADSIGAEVQKADLPNKKGDLSKEGGGLSSSKKLTGREINELCERIYQVWAKYEKKLGHNRLAVNEALKEIRKMEDVQYARTVTGEEILFRTKAGFGGTIDLNEDPDKR